MISDEEEETGFLSCPMIDIAIRHNDVESLKELIDDPVMMDGLISAYTGGFEKESECTKCLKDHLFSIPDYSSIQVSIWGAIIEKNVDFFIHMLRCGYTAGIQDGDAYNMIVESGLENTEIAAMVKSQMTGTTQLD